jgi:hypothetical protein
VVRHICSHFSRQNIAPLQYSPIIQMAGAKRRRNTRRSPPNKRRKGNARASKSVSEDPVDKATTILTDLTAASSDAERGRERTVAYDPGSEDFNERSQIRTELLTRINSILKTDVPPTFWACCQLADISCLEKLILNPQLDLAFRTIEGGLDSVPSLCKLLID